MGLLTAPYNNAMRLGSGFNSFTQQLCINNAVIKDNRETASEADLIIEQPNPHKTLVNGEVSQSVTWSAKFVNNASEVMEALNISGMCSAQELLHGLIRTGSLEIKFAGSQGGKGQGAYLNTDKMKNSDINYLVQVKVVNHRLVAKDVTRFSPVPNAPASQFTEIYGDSFISGFMEGGEFYALISMKLYNKSQYMEAGGAIQANFQAGAVGISAQAQGKFQKENATMEGTTTIDVSWVGGGNIRPPSSKGKDWDLTTVLEAANSFPEKVAIYPQRTLAILTKYSALRSYQELANKGTPLDYENAGVYTNALLDAYVDYKQIFTEIAAMSRLLQGNLAVYQQRAGDDQDLKDYAKTAQEVYQRKLRAYLKGFERPVDAQGPPPIEPADPIVRERMLELVKIDNEITKAKKKSAVVTSGEGFEEPMTPNPMRSYKGTLISLDKARQDCRWEMIKIVKEVDAVTNDPHIAIDPNRVWQYLNPALFRQLLPVGQLLPPYTQEYVQKQYITPLDSKKAELKVVQDLNATLAKEKAILTQENDGLTKTNAGLIKENTALNTEKTTLNAEKTKLTTQMADLAGTIALAKNPNTAAFADLLNELRTVKEITTKSEAGVSESSKSFKSAMQAMQTLQSLSIYDFCTLSDLKKLPPKMQQWILRSSTAWPKCRLASLFGGVNKLAESVRDGPDNFDCTLDRMSDKTDYIETVQTYFVLPDQRAMTGLKLQFASGRTVNMFDCSGSVKNSLAAGTGNYFVKWSLRICEIENFGRVPIRIALWNNVAGSSEQWSVNVGSEPNPEEVIEDAPVGGHRLKGFWAQKGATAIERLGAIWEKIN